MVFKMGSLKLKKEDLILKNVGHDSWYLNQLERDKTVDLAPRQCKHLRCYIGGFFYSVFSVKGWDNRLNSSVISSAQALKFDLKSWFRKQ